MQDVPSGNRWVGVLGLVAALAVFPLPTVGSTPEIASVVAVAAIALLAGQRWALPIVVLADVALVGALWPRAFLHDPPSQAAQVGVLLGLLGALPGLWMLSSAGSPLAEVVFANPSRRARQLSRLGVLALAAMWLAMPLL